MKLGTMDLAAQYWYLFRSVGACEEGGGALDEQDRGAWGL